MNRKIDLRNNIFNFLFSTDFIILLLAVPRKVSYFVAFIWKFTDYYEHYAAYLIFVLVWFVCFAP